jgi:osmotically-inducible protein OsmY
MTAKQLAGAWKELKATTGLILIASFGSAGCATSPQGPHAGDLAVARQPSAADEQLAAKVQAALHADPYFYDEHVTVSIERGNIVLRGFVSSGSDLRDAKRIAAKASAGRRVIDNLSINPIEEPTQGVRR